MEATEQEALTGKAPPLCRLLSLNDPLQSIKTELSVMQGSLQRAETGFLRLQRLLQLLLQQLTEKATQLDVCLGALQPLGYYLNGTRLLLAGQSSGSPAGGSLKSLASSKAATAGGVSGAAASASTQVLSVEENDDLERLKHPQPLPQSPHGLPNKNCSEESLGKVKSADSSPNAEVGSQQTAGKADRMETPVDTPEAASIALSKDARQSKTRQRQRANVPSLLPPRSVKRESLFRQMPQPSHLIQLQPRSGGSRSCLQAHTSSTKV
ncbi:hypothetical protein cyc_00655 [Cyclospora cayetanensis]|uniref:Uncharacterized protein n=1 Tax=Cyclospora cayetanensis TaxID=88456 RepID=A0A1D3D2B3_9EIME|nr:hypothetical protein cyc_00655 [Cyclospora cayetanensis]